MDSDSWTRRYQSRFDAYQGQEFEAEEEPGPEYLCPFCAEDFDLVGFFVHIDEDHPTEAKNGICPVCVKTVGADLVSHMTSQHGSLLEVQRRRRLRRGGSNSALSIFRRELRDGNLARGSPYLVSSSNVEPDPLLSSFIFSSNVVEDPQNVDPLSSAEGSVEDSNERKTERPVLSEKDREEENRKCEFVQALLISTFLDDDF